MKIEVYLTGCEIQQLRELLDSIPVHDVRLRMAINVLKALPMTSDKVETPSSVRPAPACPTRSAGSRILQTTRAHQAQMQADINRQHLEAQTFDQMVWDWLNAPLKGTMQ